MESQVLIVDSQEAINCCLRYFLDKLEQVPKVTTATTIKKAYQIAFSSSTTTSDFNIAFMDLKLPQYIEKQLHTGEDLAKLFRVKAPNTKIVFVLSDYTNKDLYRISKRIQPEGIIDKMDIREETLLEHIASIASGNQYLSPIVEDKLIKYNKNMHLFNKIELQIVQLIQQGITTKNIPRHLNITLSAVNKRKQKIKRLLEIEQGNDEDIIRECKKRCIL